MHLSQQFPHTNPRRARKNSLLAFVRPMLERMLRLVSGWPFCSRQKHVMRTRRAISKEEFVAIFSNRAVSPEIAGDVWDRMMEWCVEGLTPCPDDDVGKLYGLAEEELDEDLLLAMLQKFDCYIPTCEEIQAEGLSTRTVGDLVIFVDRMQKRKRQRG